MTTDQRERIVLKMNELMDEVRAEPEFMQDPTLRSIFVGLQVVAASVMFDAAPEFAQLCSDWCAMKVDAEAATV